MSGFISAIQRLVNTEQTVERPYPLSKIVAINVEFGCRALRAVTSVAMEASCTLVQCVRKTTQVSGTIFSLLMIHDVFMKAGSLYNSLSPLHGCEGTTSNTPFLQHAILYFKGCETPLPATEEETRGQQLLCIIALVATTHVTSFALKQIEKTLDSWNKRMYSQR